MKKQIFCIALVIIAAVNIFAQTGKTVDKINKMYAEIAEKARLCETDDEQGEIGALVMNTLTINSRDHQWRAVGIYGQTFKFFYRGVENDERRLYPDELVFVRSERRVSNRAYSEEYLYDSSGRLIYFSQKAENDDLLPGERRIYFDQARAIRIVDDKGPRDRLSAKDLLTAREASLAGTKIKSIFTRSIQL